MNVTALHRATPETSDPLEETLRAALSGLQFGTVEITVHEGCIVQIERREKQRLQLRLEPAPRQRG